MTDTEELTSLLDETESAGRAAEAEAGAALVTQAKARLQPIADKISRELIVFFRKDKPRAIVLLNEVDHREWGKHGLPILSGSVFLVANEVRKIVHGLGTLPRHEDGCKAFLQAFANIKPDDCLAKPWAYPVTNRLQIDGNGLVSVFGSLRRKLEELASGVAVGFRNRDMIVPREFTIEPLRSDDSSDDITVVSNMQHN
jgi:phenylpyruvate tautomerase PptA (4-oxalocrotonate tautomerase family)